MLFSSSEVAEYINANFEPVWESVRAAPLVTIDFGNGNVVRRTLQGNVATYVSGADGTVYDLLPGIYTPDVYRKQLEELKKLADSLRPFAAKTANTPMERLRAEWTLTTRLREYHARNEARLSSPEVVRTVTPQFTGLNSVSGPNRGSGTVTAPPAFGGFQNGAGFGWPPGSPEAIARTGGGFKGGGFPAPGASFGGNFQNLGGSIIGGGYVYGHFSGQVPMTFSGIEGPVVRVIVGAPVLAPPKPLPAGALADRPELKLDTEANERVRRKAVHAHLAKAGIVQPNDIKKWLFREVLHADLEDPLLGLGPILNENYPFLDEDRALGAKK